MTKQNWQHIYEQGGQLNRYPYDFVVSNFFHLRRLFPDKTLRVLDLGCGGGNHAIFCAENGAQVVAVDYAQAALVVVNQRASDKGLSDLITTQQVDFDDFSLEHSGFDMVIDRLSVTHAPRKNAAIVFSRLYDKLNQGGIVMSNLFSLEHSHKDFGCFDTELDVWTDFSDGIFQGLLSASFYNEQGVRHLFKQYTLEVLCLETDSDHISNTEQKAIWKIIAQK